MKTDTYTHARRTQIKANQSERKTNKTKTTPNLWGASRSARITLSFVSRYPCRPDLPCRDKKKRPSEPAPGSGKASRAAARGIPSPAPVRAAPTESLRSVERRPQRIFPRPQHRLPVPTQLQQGTSTVPAPLLQQVLTSPPLPGMASKLEVAGSGGRWGRPHLPEEGVTLAWPAPASPRQPGPSAPGLSLQPTLHPYPRHLPKTAGLPRRGLGAWKHVGPLRLAAAGRELSLEVVN